MYFLSLALQTKEGKIEKFFQELKCLGPILSYIVEWLFHETVRNSLGIYCIVAVSAISDKYGKPQLMSLMNND